MHPKGANSMAVSGLRGRKVLVSTGKAISAIFGINGLRKYLSCLVGRASISSVHGPFFSSGRLAFLGRLDCKFVNWWVWLSHVYA